MMCCPPERGFQYTLARDPPTRVDHPEVRYISETFPMCLAVLCKVGIESNGAVAAGRELMSAQPRQIVHVVLIKATRYDDDGYPMRHWRGVLPSNTLACLVGLTEAVQREQILGEGIEIRRYMYDEVVQKVPIRTL